MKFTKWIPISGIPDTLYLEGLHDDYEGFRLLLKGAGEQQRTLRISFDPVLSYRYVDEGDLLKTLSNEIGEGTLHLVTNSSFISWFTEESADIHDSESIIHYAIYTPTDCLDILSAHPPIVEWLN